MVFHHRDEMLDSISRAPADQAKAIGILDAAGTDRLYHKLEQVRIWLHDKFLGQKPGRCMELAHSYHSEDLHEL